jgi:transposase
MSLHVQPLPDVPEQTAAVARAAFPKGNRYMKMRDELGVFYRDLDFASCFATRGQPGETPWRLALILVFQHVEGLSDEQAVLAVAGRIDWKYALSLELTAAGFDASVLTEFRKRLLAGAAETQLLDRMLVCFSEAGYLKGRGRQRTDSTHVLAAVRALTRLVCVGETVRQVLNTLATVAPVWLKPHLTSAWVERYERRFDEYRLPKAAQERQRLAEQIGADGYTLLHALFAAPDRAMLCALPAVRIFHQVWLQQYQWSGEPLTVQWRSEEALPPAAQRIHSPYDADARYSAKRDTTWLGYKVHLTETCDDETPHLVTQVLTTPATTPDFEAPPCIYAALAAKQLLPAEHLLDAGYVDAGLLVSSQTDHQVTVIGPVAPAHSWQARTPDALPLACFTIDWAAKRVTCPQGHLSHKWSQTHDCHDNPIINIRFAPAHCAACPQRQRCTRSPTGPRHLTFRPQPQHEALQARRTFQTTPAFHARYKDRAGIEGTLSQAVRSHDLRRSRYLGLAKTHLHHLLCAAALNLCRVVDWLNASVRATTRTAAFVSLALTFP